MPVLGMGGFFFRSDDPNGLTDWYRDHLGIGPGLAAEGAGPADEWSWMAQGGPFVFAPFEHENPYWTTDQPFMLNLRVSHLDDLIARLTAAGIEVTSKDAWDAPETGRFARIKDPEGNPIELWEPPAGA